jgi:hypothetical protein
MRLPATINSHDQEAIQKLLHDWRYRHGELRACHAQWVVEEDNKIRWFPAKIVHLVFVDTVAEVSIDTETGKATVVKNPDNKPHLEAPHEPTKSDPPVFGMQPLEERPHAQ